MYVVVVFKLHLHSKMFYYYMYISKNFLVLYEQLHLRGTGLSCRLIGSREFRATDTEMMLTFYMILKNKSIVEISSHQLTHDIN